MNIPISAEWPGGQFLSVNTLITPTTPPPLAQCPASLTVTLFSFSSWPRASLWAQAFSGDQPGTSLGCVLPAWQRKLLSRRLGLSGEGRTSSRCGIGKAEWTGRGRERGGLGRPASSRWLPGLRSPWTAASPRELYCACGKHTRFPGSSVKCRLSQ